jgi:Raf kinase inhibitor-like YbhB/YbcL family protein
MHQGSVPPLGRQPLGRLLLSAALGAVLAACSSGSIPTVAPPASGMASGGASPEAAGSVETSPSPSASTITDTPSALIERSPMATLPPSPVALSLTSSAFQDGGAIPREYSCHGRDLSPPLAWQGVPAGTGALVLFVDDPDGHDWVHWTVLDLAGADGALPRAVSPTEKAPQQGRNDFGRVGYGGPCPPSGTHHYRFTLYALTAPLGLPGHPDGSAVRAALRGATILGQVTLVGTYRA